MKIARSIVNAVVCLLMVSCAPSQNGDVADTVYTNGRTYTVDEAQPWAEAVVIKDGKFLAVTGRDTEVVDLDGKFVMPGFIDVHVHPGTGGLGRVTECSLPGTLDAPTWDQLL